MMTPLFIGGIGKGEQTLTLFIQILPFFASSSYLCDKNFNKWTMLFCA